MWHYPVGETAHEGVRERACSIVHPSIWPQAGGRADDRVGAWCCALRVRTAVHARWRVGVRARASLQILGGHEHAVVLETHVHSNHRGNNWRDYGFGGGIDVSFKWIPSLAATRLNETGNKERHREPIDYSCANLPAICTHARSRRAWRMQLWVITLSLC